MKNEKLTQFIIKLIKLTRSEELTWTPYIPKDKELPGGGVILDKGYETTISDRNIVLYRYKYKYYTDEFNFDWFTKINLELQDSDGHTDYVFDFNNSMNDLYDIVREQTSEVLDIIDEFLGFKLEILEAKYFTAKNSIDVTTILNNKVSNNKLTFVVSNDIFEDPEFGAVKKILIKYLNAGEIKEKEFTEGQTVSLP